MVRSSELLRNKKQVYIKLKLINGNEELTSIVISENQSCVEIKELFKLKCDVSEEFVVLKLRNQKGSIIPFSYSSFENNTRETPYLLEAVKPHSSVVLSERTVSNDATYSIEVWFFLVLSS